MEPFTNPVNLEAIWLWFSYARYYLPPNVIENNVIQPYRNILYLELLRFYAWATAPLPKEAEHCHLAEPQL